MIPSNTISEGASSLGGRTSTYGNKWPHVRPYAINALIAGVLLIPFISPPFSYLAEKIKFMALQVRPQLQNLLSLLD